MDEELLEVSQNGMMIGFVPKNDRRWDGYYGAVLGIFQSLDRKKIILFRRGQKASDMQNTWALLAGSINIHDYYTIFPYRDQNIALHFSDLNEQDEQEKKKQTIEVATITLHREVQEETGWKLPNCQFWKTFKLCKHNKFNLYFWAFIVLLSFDEQKRLESSLQAFKQNISQRLEITDIRAFSQKELVEEKNVGDILQIYREDFLALLD